MRIVSNTRSRHSFSNGEEKWICYTSSFEVGCFTNLSGFVRDLNKRRVRQAFWDKAVNWRIAKHWFQKFRSGHLSLCKETVLSVLVMDGHRFWMMRHWSDHNGGKQSNMCTCVQLAEHFQVIGEADRLNLYHTGKTFKLRECFHFLNCTPHIAGN